LPVNLALIDGNLFCESIFVTKARQAFGLGGKTHAENENKPERSKALQGNCKRAGDFSQVMRRPHPCQKNPEAQKTAPQDPLCGPNQYGWFEASVALYVKERACSF
jgi:hypothetical protein